jgi:sugar phosphate isomerase/epimerase
MRLCVSSIAWPDGADAAAADALRRLGVTAIEVAPRKHVGDPAAADDATIDACRQWWSDRGFDIVAAQALLFGRPDLTLFADPATRERTLEHLRRVIRACARLGAAALVFGAPANRRITPRSAAEVADEAVEFFRRLADCAAGFGAAVVIEANPPRYGADYLTTVAEAAALVRAVDHPGLRLHLDTACMTIAGDDPATSIRAHIDIIRHVHISELDLGPVGAGATAVDHAAFATALRAAGYRGAVSIEMRGAEPFTPEPLERAVAFARQVYGAESARPVINCY